MKLLNIKKNFQMLNLVAHQNLYIPLNTNLYTTNTQYIIHIHVHTSNLHTCTVCAPAKLPFEESSRQQAASDMECVVTYYCKSRNLQFSPDSGWSEILLLLSSLHLTRADLFNCFYSMVTKYIPRCVCLLVNSLSPSLPPSLSFFSLS